jgi:hypothetical protein
MQKEYSKTSSETISFRYKMKGASKTSSYSVSQALIYLLSDVEKCSYLEAKQVCTNFAKTLKEHGFEGDLSKFVKCNAYRLIIDKNLLINYETSTANVSKTCAFYLDGNRKTTRVELPDIIFYALSVRFSNPNYEVYSSYQSVRDEFKKAPGVNFEEAMRLKLLNLLKAN